MLNKALRRRESLWSSSAPGNTLLLDTDVVIDTMLYIWLNPVQAGLVTKVDDWNHLQILPKNWGKSMRFKRPDFFQVTGDSERFPKFIEIVPMPPKMFSHLSLIEVIAYFEKRIADEELRIRNELKKKKGTKVMGMDSCYRQSPFSSPKAGIPMYTRNPRFSGTKVNVISSAIEGMTSFWRIYKKRLEEFRKGSKTNFPAGTIMMRERFGCSFEKLGRGDPHQPNYVCFQFV